MMLSYLDRMFWRRDITTRACNVPDVAVAVNAAKPYGGPFFIPPSLYDAAEREGVDMRPYVKQQPIPKASH